MSRSEPLNELDVALLGLQRAGRPWSVHFEAELRDPLTPSALETGVEHALRRHPRAGAALDGGHGEPQWILGRFGADDLLVDGGRTELLDRPFSLAEEPGVRIARSEDGRGLIVAVNHALADGLGGATLVHDLLAGAAGSRDRSPRLPVPAGLASRLHRRHRLGALRSTLTTASYVLGGGLRTSADPAAPTTVSSSTLDAGLRRRLIAGRAAGVGLNDLILAATHLALRDAIGAPPSGRIAVSVPVDLRRHIGAPPGLGNAIVSALTSSGGRMAARSGADDLALAARLGAAVRRQAEPARLAGTTAMFVSAAARGRRRPPRERTGRLRWPDTAVCSNLGDLDCFGPAWAAVRSLTFTPPAHDLMSIGVASAGGSTTIAARQRGGDGEPRAVVDGIVARLDEMLSRAL